MSPCPDNDNINEKYYNCAKGFAKNCYDRLDLFMKTEEFKQNQEWIKWFDENKKIYELEDFMVDFGEVPTEKDDYVDYINKVIEIIKKRGKILCEKVEKN